MPLAIGLTLLLPLVLGVSAGQISDRLRPAAATRWLTAGALVAALASGFSLAVLGFTLLARWPLLARLGHWSTASLARHELAPGVAAAIAGVTVVALLARALRAVWSAGRGLVDSELACRPHGHQHGLVVVRDQTPTAYAVHGLRGRIVVSTGMLAALPAEERRVLLAHEDAHLRHRHHVYRALADIAAAAHPLLRPVASSVRFTTERWADEDAAAAVGDRALVARAIARASLAGRSVPPAAALALTGSDVTRRVRALLRPAPGRRTGLQVALSLALVAVCASAGWAERSTEATFEGAQVAAGQVAAPSR